MNTHTSPRCEYQHLVEPHDNCLINILSNVTCINTLNHSLKNSDSLFTYAEKQLLQSLLTVYLHESQVAV